MAEEVFYFNGQGRESKAVVPIHAHRCTLHSHIIWRRHATPDATNAAKNSKILPRTQLWWQLKNDHPLSTLGEKGDATVFNGQSPTATPSMKGTFEMPNPQPQNLSFPGRFKTPCGVRGM